MILSNKFKIKTVFNCTYKVSNKKQLMIYAHLLGVKKFSMWFWRKENLRKYLVKLYKGTNNAAT